MGTRNQPLIDMFGESCFHVSMGVHCYNPSLPNTSRGGVLGVVMGSKYDLTFSVWKPRVFGDADFTRT